MSEKILHPKFSLINIFWVITGLVISFALHLLTGAGIKESYYTLILFALTCFLFNYFSSRKNSEILSGMLLGITLFLIIHVLYHAALTYKIIPEWDFLCFYLFGKVGVSSPDFYNPHVFLQHFNELNLQARTGSSFKNEILEVGFWYPPPSMFLFLPLGLFDLQTGYIVWQTMIIILLVVDIYLLVRLYSPTANLPLQASKVAFPILVLILLFPNITASITFSQTVSLFLLLLILLIHYIDNWKAGVFLAILFFIKPLAGVFILYFLFFRKWKVLTASAITGIIILLITILSFGFQTLLNYFISAPTDRIPDYVYFEYQSLFGVLKRLQQNIPGYMSIHSMKILYYLISIFFVGLTFYSSRKLYQISKTFGFIVFIPLALLIYPATLFHYSIMSLPVVLYIYNQSPFKNTVWNLVLLFFLYIIGFYNFFLFNLLLWGILVAWSAMADYVKNNNRLGHLFSKSFESKRISY